MRVAIVGAGPAGLTAAGYLATRNYEVDVYDKLPAPGGLMLFAIPSRRIPPKAVIEGCEDLEKNFGVKFYLRKRIGSGGQGDIGEEFASDAIPLEKLAEEYNAVLVATGTWRERRLGIPGEASSNVLSALEFLYKLKLSELGFSKNRVSIGRRVVVIGGGLSAVDAVEAALELAKEVYLVYRRTIREAPAGSYRIKELVRRGVVFIELAQPVRIIAEGDTARAVEFVRMRLGESDETGRPRPIPVPGSEFAIEADTIIAAIGELPTPPAESRILTKYMGTEGRISVGKDYRLPETNIFAAGDVVSGPTKIGLAIDSALKAARSLDSALSGDTPSISDIIKSSPIRELVFRFASWDHDLGRILCDFLGANASVEPSKCLSSTPFLRAFDYSKCVGCETCGVVCGFIHEGRALVKIQKTADGLVFPLACLHCSDAKCASVCKRNAIVRGPLGEIVIDYSRCNNCLDCFYSCFIKAVRIRGGTIVNCDLCKALRDRGLEPACLSMCPSCAIALYSH